jgi:hypothetical protein
MGGESLKSPLLQFKSRTDTADVRTIKALDEYGIPFPLGRKIAFLFRGSPTLEDAIGTVQAYFRSPSGERRLIPIELDLIQAAVG